MMIASVSHNLSRMLAALRLISWRPGQGRSTFWNASTRRRRNPSTWRTLLCLGGAGTRSRLPRPSGGVRVDPQGASTWRALRPFDHAAIPSVTRSRR